MNAIHFADENKQAELLRGADGVARWNPPARMSVTRLY